MLQKFKKLFTFSSKVKHNCQHLNNHANAIKEQHEHDHRYIGRQQKLFVFSKYSPGSAIFMPHGTKIYHKLVEFIRKEYRKRGFQEVITPNIFNKELWEISGHLDKYSKNIYMIEDDQMGLKPMNCPGHCILFQISQHSYKELPIRYADFGVLHRNEVHGSLTGLTRVRRFVQDDAHIFCTQHQIQQEIIASLEFLDSVYKRFGFEYQISLSTRPDEFIGEIDLWDMAENQLKEALKFKNMSFTIHEQQGAFYGPKIDISLNDSHGKQHQCGTIQLDFNLPLRFGLQYREDDIKSSYDQMVDEEHHHTELKQGFHRPVLIHRAILGSLERMMAILTEQYRGKWPFWLSPRQILVLNVSESSRNYAQEIYQNLFNEGFEVEADLSDSTLGRKIRNGELEHFNYIVIVGEKEIQEKLVDVRQRGDSHHKKMSLQELLKELSQIQL